MRAGFAQAMEAVLRQRGEQTARAKEGVREAMSALEEISLGIEAAGREQQKGDPSAAVEATARTASGVVPCE